MYFVKIEQLWERIIK